MAHVPYIGSGPYCYANSFAMMLGKDAPSPAVIEFCTSSPFGMECIGPNVVFFDPYAWDPSTSFQESLTSLGWKSRALVGKNAEHALAMLKQELKKGPVFVGPIEMGLLRYQPGPFGAIGADHYVVVLGIEGARLDLHDPHGYPYACIPVSEFMEAWKAEKIAYGKPYMMQTDFERVEVVSEEEAIRRSLPNARKWLSMEGDHDMPPGSAGNAAAAEALAKKIESNFHPGVKNPLVYFAVRVGVRRLGDAATCLARIGYHEAAEIMAKQARLVGSLQYPLTVDDTKTAAKILRELAPTYDLLKVALQEKR